MGHSGQGTMFDSLECESLARNPETASLQWMLFLALKALVEDDERSGDLRGGAGLGGLGMFGNQADVSDLSTLGIERWGASVPGDGNLPSDLAVKLESFGLLPPRHHLIRSESVETSANATANATMINGVSRGGSGEPQMRSLLQAYAYYMAAGVGPWPLVLSEADADMLALESLLVAGDKVDVAPAAALQEPSMMRKDAFTWSLYYVCEVIPMTTLNDEVGAALVLERGWCGNASNIVRGESFHLVNKNRFSLIDAERYADSSGKPDILHISSRIWTENEHLWAWRPSSQKLREKLESRKQQRTKARGG